MIEKIQSMNQLSDVSHIKEFCAFRGQSDASWHLTTTFERAASNLKSADRRDLERKIILEFKRRAHHYLSKVPENDNHLEWLSLLQHYGGPTRLLDFTRSFYISLYFAIEGAQSNSALWVVDVSFLSEEKPTLDVKSTYSEEAERASNKILKTPSGEDEKPGIIAVEPFRLNERMSIQQGLHLFPKNLYKTFEQNMFEPLRANSLEDLDKTGNKYTVRKYIIPKELHLPITYWLDQMNITAATLFPGLDGFARSQITHVKLAQYSREVVEEMLRVAQKNLAKQMKPF